ncbi:cache domain-containing protein, partial [Campylobacter volucris]|uniref:PDC sensor domain-containing protein n=1 Tax=Campylobacter volucris TaxID=1031542 RepID=UPI00189EA6DF
MFKSVSGRLTLIVGIVSMIVLIVVNTLSYFNTKNDTYSNLGELQRKTMLDTAEVFRVYAHSKRNAIEVLAHEIAKQDFSNEDIVYDFLEAFEKANEFDIVYLGIDSNGRLYQSDRTYLDLSKGFDVKSRQWYIDARTKGKLIVSDPYTSVTDNRTKIAYAIPISLNGRFIGVLGADYDVEKFSNEVLKVGKSSHSYTAIFDQEGNIFFHPDSSQLGKRTKLSESIQNFYQKNPNFLNPDSEDNIVYMQDDKNELQAVMCSLQLGYKVCTVTKESVYSDEVREDLIRQVTVAIIAIIVALALVRISISKSLSPLQKIQSGLNSFFDFINHKTKDSNLIDVKTNDEFGAMAIV